ncbi:MAG: phage tail assembly chaperone, partial [Asticcacaulis sp.]
MNSWPAHLRHALRLGITPEAFWRLSWREWRWLTGTASAPVMDRAT